VILEESLFSFLSSDTAVGSVVADRIYGLIQPQKGLQPCIVYSRIATLRSQTLCATDSKVRAMLLIDCYDKTYKGSKLLAEVVRQTLTDFSGDMAGTRISSVALDAEVDRDDPEPGLYSVSQTYFIWFTEE
jgi:hypothetical protein